MLKKKGLVTKDPKIAAFVVEFLTKINNDLSKLV